MKPGKPQPVQYVPPVDNAPLFVRADPDGKILAFGAFYVDVPNSVKATGPIPNDFAQTAGTGKYKFLDGRVIEVESWIPPVPHDFSTAATFQETPEL